MTPSIKILRTYAEVQPFLHEIVTAADSHRLELGFIPRGAYQDQANKNRLWVALYDGVYAGHLLLGGTYPNIRIFQAFAHPRFRRQKIGLTLIEHLKAFANDGGYSTISAQVGADLDKANAFWASAGFRAIRQKRGGSTTGREIIIRELLIAQNTLFPLEIGNKSRIADIIRLRNRHTQKAKSYAVDVNVLVDVAENRIGMDDAASMLGMAMSGSIQLFVTSELHVELSRKKVSEQHAQLNSFANSLQTLPHVDPGQLEASVSSLRRLIFPNRRTDRSRATQDASDLLHLALTIHHGLSGFVTGEKAILNKSEEIFEKFQISICTAADFITGPKLNTLPTTWRSPAGNDFTIADYNEAQREQCVAFLKQLGHESEEVNAVLTPGTTQEPRTRLCLMEGKEVYGLASWRKAAPLIETSEAYLLVDESHNGALTFVDAALERISRDSATFAGRIIHLFIGIDQNESLQMANTLGYEIDTRAIIAQKFHLLRKFAFSGIVYSDNWKQFCTSVAGLTKIKMPAELPSFAMAKQDGIHVNHENNKSAFLDHADLETYLKPVLLLFPGRQGLIIPIKPGFAEDLLGNAPKQMSLLPGHEASFKPERTYFRKPTNVKIVRSGMPIIFYASGKIGAAIGCGRVVESDVRNIHDIEVQVRARGVLDNSQLQGQASKEDNTHMITFDAFQPFSKHIGLKKLQEMNFDKVNFQTIQKLSPTTVVRLCELGFFGITK